MIERRKRMLSRGILRNGHESSSTRRLTDEILVVCVDVSLLNVDVLLEMFSALELR